VDAMSNLTRLKRLEKSAKVVLEDSTQVLKSSIDFSTWTDEELQAWVEQYDRDHPYTGPDLTGMTDQQLSDLYFREIRADDKPKAKKKR
jgi:hypothetical protein